jgi:hypothetical protein
MGITTEISGFNGEKVNVTKENELLVKANATTDIIGFSTSEVLDTGEVFDSGLISLDGYSQVQTEIDTDQDGTLNFIFYEDSSGLNVIRTLSVPYYVADGFQLYSAPAFGHFARYKFTNTGLVAQTKMFYTTKLLTKSISGQVLGVDAPIAKGMVANLGRNVLAGQDNAGDFGNVRITPSRELATSLFDSETGSRQIVDLNGSAKSGEAFVLIGDAFYGQTLNALHWNTAFTGSGSEIGLPGTHRISTGITANSKFCLQSVRPARFMIAQFNIAHFGIQLNTADLTDVNCIRRFGVFDPINSGSENGLFFEITSLDGINPQWYCVSIKDGVETSRTAQADFNGASAELVNPTSTVSAYERQYNAGTAFFFQGSKFIHQVKGVPVYAGTYNFNVGFSIENTNGNTADNLLDFRAGGVYRLGEPKGDPIGRAFTTNTVVKNGTGFISSASLSRTGSSGGAGTLKIYDGIDNTGFLIGRVDVGGDDLKGINIGGTFTTGLYIEISGSGTNTANLTFE